MHGVGAGGFGIYPSSQGFSKSGYMKFELNPSSSLEAVPHKLNSLFLGKRLYGIWMYTCLRLSHLQPNGNIPDKF